MTESEFNESADAVFARMEQIARDSHVTINRTLSGSTLKLEFADGQRIVTNHDVVTHKIWLAARSGGTEYSYSGKHWLAQDRSELLAKFAELLHQVIQSNRLNAQPGKLLEVHQPLIDLAAPAMLYQNDGGSAMKKILVLGLLLMLGYAVFYKTFSDRQTAAPLAGEANLGEENLSDSQCDTVMPKNGTTHIFPAGNIHLDSSRDTEITLQNDHGHPFLATFTAPNTVIPYFSILVNAGQTARVAASPGQYDLLLSVGNSWCNLSKGFSGGERIKLNTTLNALPQQPLQLVAQSSGTGFTDLQILIKSYVAHTEPPPIYFTGNGVMEIRQHSDGHYHLAGAVNGSTVNFLIDTGASLTSLTPDTARQAGIVDCKPSTFKTANGTITGCTAAVAQLTLGNYQMQNIIVAVMPNMEINLLGMNVLNHFDMTQANDTMRLTSR